MFWKTITPFLSRKVSWLTRITLIENEVIITDNQKVAENISNFFEEGVGILDIRGCNNISNTVGYSDPVECAIINIKYEI